MERADDGSAADPSVGRAPPMLLLFLALRGLRDDLLSVTLLILAVAAGVAFQIPNIANLAGYRAELLRQEVAAGNGHVRVRPRRGERMNDGVELARRLRGIPGVDEVVGVLVLPGAIDHGGRLAVVPVTGVDAGTRHHPYELTAGLELAVSDREAVLLGERLARRLKVKPGDVVHLQVLLATRPRLVLEDEGVGSYSMEVKGLVGLVALDQAFVSRAFLGAELGEEGAASVLLVYAHDDSIDRARSIARTIEAAAPQVTATAWFDDSRYIRTTVQAIDVVQSIAAGMSLAGVSIPVLALLYINVLRRRRQISLLAAVGFRAGEIFLVFLLMAIVVGVVGSVIGTGVGLSWLAYFTRHPIFSYEKFVVRPVLEVSALLRPIWLVLLTTTIAGSLPAWLAARVDASGTLRRIE